jgi:hypothetical protein
VGRHGPGRRLGSPVQPPVGIPIPQISGALGRGKSCGGWDGCGRNPSRKDGWGDSMRGVEESRAVGALTTFSFLFLHTNLLRGTHTPRLADEDDGCCSPR